MHRSLMQFNACKLKMRIVAVLGERVSDVTQSCTSGRIMILVSQLLEWNGQPRGDTKKLGSSAAELEPEVKRRFSITEKFLTRAFSWFGTGGVVSIMN